MNSWFRGLWAVATISACTAPMPEVDSLDWRAEAIYGGTIDTADAAVVGLVLSSGGYVCTGALIEPDIVLTAAHCLVQREVGYSNARAVFGDTLGAASTVLIAAYSAHPQYNSSSKANDLGLVRLVGPAPSTVTPLSLPPAPFALAPSHQGSSIRFVGFGRTASEPTGTKRQVSLSLGLVCSGTANCPYLGYTVAIGSMGYGQSTGGPCLGDSGGPVLMQVGGTEHVIGVNATGDSACTVMGVSTIADRHRSFIRTFIDSAPLSSRCTYLACPVGDVCSSSSDCGALKCVATPGASGAAGGTCTAECTVGASTCPGGSLCAEATNLAGPRCWAQCVSSTDCRPGWSCSPTTAGLACLPTVTTEPDPEEPPPDSCADCSPNSSAATDQCQLCETEPELESGGCAALRGSSGLHTCVALAWLLGASLATRKRRSS